MVNPSPPPPPYTSTRPCPPQFTEEWNVVHSSLSEIDRNERLVQIRRAESLARQETHNQQGQTTTTEVHDPRSPPNESGRHQHLEIPPHFTSQPIPTSLLAQKRSLKKATRDALLSNPTLVGFHPERYLPPSIAPQDSQPLHSLFPPSQNPRPTQFPKYQNSQPHPALLANTQAPTHLRGGAGPRDEFGLPYPASFTSWEKSYRRSIKVRKVRGAVIGLLGVVVIGVGVGILMWKGGSEMMGGE